ncbi:hypothetical protein NDU88_005804 [Pleurodeles waltl]|uniref:Uncharacterized protein n=1 Tax=Pleurodeles waltl TaxID=8319 RepID=A0AAV7WZQ0_PLEWA|nr:hypothetical protein NDU88_005804 [Pleurodeles waltl]
MCPEGQIPCSSLPRLRAQVPIVRRSGPLAPPASLLLCFFGARSSGLRRTPSALLRPSERPLAPVPSPAKPLRSLSLLFGPDPVFSLPRFRAQVPIVRRLGPLAPPDSLLLCFFGARSSSLRSTPSALLRSSERPLAPAPSPAKPLCSRSLLFLVCRRLSQRWPHAHTRVPGCTGPAKQTARKFSNLHRSRSASLRSGSTVLQCPPQLSRSAIAVCPQGWV